MTDQLDHLIQCASCGSNYHTKRSNTKYCAICRLFADICYIGKRTTKCILCNQRIAQLNRGTLMCANCDPVHSSLYGHGSCRLCEAEDVTTVRKGVAVCVACAMDPAKRTQFMRALAAKIQRMKSGDDNGTA